MKQLISPLFAIAAVWSSCVVADTQAEIDAFIQQLDLKTFDCPAPESVGVARDFLSSDTVNPRQANQLKLVVSHGLICEGQYGEALNSLNSLVESSALQNMPRSYANALYQIGFIYDVREDNRRCGYYQQAEAFAENKFPDIYLSAQLSLLNSCETGASDGVKLGKLYALLEKYSQLNDSAATAHIHNNIGLLYGSLGQQVLAAEQYQKAYELGLDEYTSSNLLATLISVISAQMASGDFDAAEASIKEFRRVNKQVDTPLSNNWLYFAEAGYYYRTGDFDKLRISLARWKIYLPEVQNYQYEGFYRWYEAALCLHERNLSCLRSFIEAENNAPANYRNMVMRNKDYLRLRVEIDLFFGDVDAAQQNFERFADILLQKNMKQQEAAKVLGVAQLHNQILSLESDLQQSRREQTISLIKTVLITAIVVLACYLFLRKKFFASLVDDAQTGLLCRKAVIEQIKKVSKPEPGKTNAIALFDLDNLRKQNDQIGQLTHDVTLRRVAGTLKNVTRDVDIIGRLSANQFLVCLTNIDEPSSKHFVERIRQALESTIQSVSQVEKVDLQSSMSIYVSSEGFTDLDEVLEDMERSLTKPLDTAQSVS